METEETVKKLEEELKIKDVEVSEKKDAANKVAEVVGKEKASVELQNNNANEKARECARISVEVQAIKEECEIEVRKLEPMVEAALEKVSKIEKDAITQTRSLPNPPDGVPQVLFCIMNMFANVPGFSDNIELNKKGLPAKLDWKTGALKLMGDPGKFKSDLVAFPQQIALGKVPQQNFKQVIPYLELPAL